MKKNNVLIVTLLLIYFATHTAEDTHLFLKQISTIEDPNEAQKHIRLKVRGDLAACTTLFKTAFETNNAVAQLYCTNAYRAMMWSKDAEKNFDMLDPQKLESYHFVLSQPGFPSALWFLGNFYAHTGFCSEKEIGTGLDLAKKTIQQAAQEKNVFGMLLLLEDQTYGDLHFGHACKMRPLINKDGKLPFSEAQSIFNKATQHVRKHRPELKQLPIKLLDLFEQHDMPKIQRIIEDDWLTAYSEENRLILHNACTLDFSIEKGKVHIHMQTIPAYKPFEKELAPLINFLADAYSRCRNCIDLVGIVDDLRESTGFAISESIHKGNTYVQPHLP